MQIYNIFNRAKALVQIIWIREREMTSDSTKRKRLRCIVEYVNVYKDTTFLTNVIRKMILHYLHFNFHLNIVSLPHHKLISS